MEQAQEKVLPLRPLEALSSTTRIELAHKRHSKAVERVKDLESQLDLAFEELWGAGEDLAKQGIEINVTLQFPIKEAWFDWRAKRTLR